MPSPVIIQDQYRELINLLHQHKMSANAPGDNITHSTTPNTFLVGIGACFLSSKFHHDWIIDSGASDHITPHLDFFSSYKPITGICDITMPNGKRASVKHVGTVKLANGILLQRVLHVPDFQYNLLSVQKLTYQHQCVLIFHRGYCILVSK